MTKVSREGGLPSLLKSFLGSKLPGEGSNSEIWSCTYEELEKRAKEEDLEVQCLIDRKNDRSYAAAIGASIRTLMVWPHQEVNPVVYFAEVPKGLSKQFMSELDKAREEVRAQIAFRAAQRATKVNPVGDKGG